MTRTELGSRPLICDTIRKSALYIQCMKSNPGSLTSQALKYEDENNEDSYILQLVSKFTPYFQEIEEFGETLKRVQNKMILFIKCGQLSRMLPTV